MLRMETATIAGVEVSRIGLGTWAIGGLEWGAIPDDVAIATCLGAVERGISLIDTAPIYGHGRSEEIVGKAMRAYGRRVPANLENTQNEDVVEEFEEQEPEESATEDLTEPGARERDSLADENSQDRQRLRADNSAQTGQEKETVLHLRPENTEKQTGWEGFSPNY